MDVNTVSKLTVSVENDSTCDGLVVKPSSIHPVMPRPEMRQMPSNMADRCFIRSLNVPGLYLLYAYGSNLSIKRW